MKYLPPYSPDLNPIEYSFSVIKKEIRNKGIMEEGDNLVEFAQAVLKVAADKVTEDLARNQFRHCNIRVI